MSKPERLLKTWASLAFVTGTDKMNCYALRDLTGFDWVCRRLVDSNGESDIRYAVRKGPSAHAGREVVKALNDMLYEGYPVFQLMGDSKEVIAVSRDVVNALKSGKHEVSVTPKDIRRAMVRIVGECEAADLIERTQRNAVQLCRDAQWRFKR